MKAPIGLTMGDPAGIGPEIVARLFAEGSGAPCVVYGDPHVLRRASRAIGLALEVEELGSWSAEPDALMRRLTGRPGHLPVVAVGVVPETLATGRVSALAGAAAYSYVVRAIDDALAGRIAAIVTAPINKDAMHAAGIRYPGHTEILADRTGTGDFAMMLVNADICVLLVSIHVSVAEAVRAVTFENEMRAIRLAHRAARELGVAEPRVAVAGLNPHAGENGLFGREDLDIITPAIAAARAAGIDASGPWPGDTVFMRARRGDFDIVVAQYHDQGLIPVKYLGLDHGVNVTVGLPFPRTSVDHGTAFDIAGQGIADPSSLRAALRQAMSLVAPRLPTS